MKKAESIFSVFILLGIILKLFDVPGNSIILILSFSSLAVIYFNFGFLFFNDIRLRDIFKRESYKKVTAKRTVGAIATGIALSLILIGILFKIEIWPGSSNIIKPGLFLLSIIIIITLVLRKDRKSRFYKKIYTRTLIIGLFGIIAYLIPFDLLIDLYYDDKPEVAEIMKEVMKDPYNEENQEELDKAWEKYLE
tara:strand:- start:114 stop:695 length:582 start_codon:yes stop_codon:yes gene_type:complete